jgi:hypothetical protein
MAERLPSAHRGKMPLSWIPDSLSTKFASSSARRKGLPDAEGRTTCGHAKLGGNGRHRVASSRFANCPTHAVLKLRESSLPRTETASATVQPGSGLERGLHRRQRGGRSSRRRSTSAADRHATPQPRGSRPRPIGSHLTSDRLSKCPRPIAHLHLDRGETIRACADDMARRSRIDASVRTSDPASVSHFEIRFQSERHEPEYRV